ncbi:MAG: DUF3800 domain-containing protein [Parcubacteria group bacterium]|nr:DUF3800 domain-containing protein [Parcubacteria group bacterium]
MAYIFLDESGDLGFNFKKRKTSNFFVVTCLFVSNKRVVEKIIKITHSELKKKYKRRFGVLHCFKERPAIRRRLLNRLCDVDCSIMAIYLNKKKVYTKLQNEKQVLYNYVTNILLDRIYSKNIIPTTGVVKFVASRRETNKFLNKNFENYLMSQVQGRHKVKIDISIRVPSHEKSLQAVDFASWAIFRKYEHGDNSYYDIIKKKIIEESPLFP